MLERIKINDEFLKGVYTALGVIQQGWELSKDELNGLLSEIRIEMELYINSVLKRKNYGFNAFSVEELEKIVDEKVDEELKEDAKFVLQIKSSINRNEKRSSDEDQYEEFLLGGFFISYALYSFIETRDTNKKTKNRLLKTVVFVMFSFLERYKQFEGKPAYPTLIN